MDIFDRVCDRVTYNIAKARRKVMGARFVRTSPDAYATHLPILIGVAAIASPGRILELGSGKFSTAALNDPALFPSVGHIHTMEDDAEWAEIVRTLPLDSARSTIELVPSIRERLSELDMSPYDLIFVDNAVSVAERAATLRVVLDKARSDVIIVMHDFEWRAYRDAVSGNWKTFTFTAW